MRKLFYALIISLLFLQTTTVLGQIAFTVELQDDNVTYLVKLRPEVSYAAPLNTTNNAQLSFVVPTGGFKAGNINSIKGIWLNDNNVVAPEENPDNDYLVFNLSGNISDIDYVANEEVDLFSFQNSGECTGTLSFITEEDPFFFNSKNINIGNQISVLGAGFINAYSGSYGAQANCRESQGGIQNCVLVDSVITTNPTLCGTVGGTITIHARVDNGLPLQYSIDDGETYQPDSVFTGLVSGTRYSVRIRDEVPLCEIDYGVVELGPPADAVIIRTTTTPDSCMQTNGTIKIEAVPIVASTALEFSIDTGRTWLENDGLFTGLAAGKYLPRVRAKDAPCNDETEEIIVEIACDNGGTGGDTTSTDSDASCIYSYVLDIEDGKFIISLLSDTTISIPQNTTATAQITIKVPTGGFQVANFQNLMEGVQFAENGRSNSPSEAPEFDYIVFGLTTLGTRNIEYTKGKKIPLFSFENGGECSGKQIFLMENFTDPFYPPNSGNANVGQQITVALTGSDLSIVCSISNEISDCAEDLESTGGNGPEDFSKDTLFYTIPVEETINICLGDELDIDQENLGRVVLCSSNNTVMATLTDGSNCIEITTDDHFNQAETLCIIHFDNNDSISDTTVFIICPSVNLGTDLSICEGTTTQLMPFGGTGNFTWVTEGDISCTDCSNPEISPDSSTQYIILSMDGEHCKDYDTIMVNVKDSPQILEVMSVNPTDCETNGQISILADEGGGPFRYSIDNGTTFQDSSLFTGLGAGNFDVTVANQNETCSSSMDQQISLVSDSAPEIVGIEAISPNTCTSDKGSIAISAFTETVETLEYSIDGGNSWQTDSLFSDLEIGTYDVQVRIQNSNCLSVFSNNPIQLSQQDAIQVTTSPGDRTICSDESRTIHIEGSENIADFTITGGAYENAIVDGNMLTFRANPTAEGTIYTVMLVGESGCTVMDDFTLTMGGENTDSWAIDISTTPASCDDNDGSISVTVNGNNNGFTFCWEPNKASGPTREGLSSDSTYNLTITGSSGCSVVRDNLRTGTDCMVSSCNIFTGLDTLTAFVVGEEATACIPVANMDLSEFEFYSNGQLEQMRFGECLQTSFFYDYGTLIDLGGTPYKLIEWSVNQDTLKDFEFNTMEELVSRMNQFDYKANWVLNEELQLIQGFSTDNMYGSLEVQPNGSSQIPELQLTPMNTMYQSIILESTRGIKKYTIVDPLNECEDELYINVRGLNDGMDTMELVTLINTPLVDQCLNTEETGLENLEIRICDAPSAGTLTIGTSSDHCFSYTPNPDFVGKDFLCLELCNGTICDTTLITITVQEEGLVFHTGFSPNNDGINDLFTIKNIDNYPENNLIIYNRWGNLILKKEGYTNDEGWDGTFETNISPDGVYFYLLKVVIDEEEQFFSGSITLNR